MKTFQLSGEQRQEVGKKYAKKFRKEGLVPCVLYGGEELIHFVAKEGDIRRIIYTPNVYIVELTIGNKTVKSIIKDLQFHPVSDATLHVDFLEVFADKPVVVELPVRLEGFAPGVKAGGKLTLAMRRLRVRGIYTELPEEIVVDVSKLKLGKSIQVGDLSFDKLELLNANNAVVAQVKLTRAARGAASADEDEEETESAEGAASDEAPADAE